MDYEFICQKIDGDIVHDFVLETKHAVDYMNWYENSNNYKIRFIERLDEIRNIHNNRVIPVGTVEFVEGFYRKFYNIKRIQPINIPKELLGYTQRKVWYGDETEEIVSRVFCKSIDKVKGFTDVIDKNTKLEPGKYLFSELVDIESEWRCFIYRGNLLGVHNYINSLEYYPDIKVIKEMVDKYKGLEAYTLDVGVNDKGTFVIEVHDFYSCGLYGFRDYSKLLYMYILSHNQKLSIKNTIRQTI